MPADLVDQELVCRLKEGDAEALGELYRLYYDVAYSSCCRVLQNPHDAEDAAHDTFLRMREKISSFRGDCAFSSWIYRLATHISLNMIRDRQVSSATESLDELDPDGDEQPAAAFFDPIPQIDLDTALQQVPRRDRLFFRKQMIEGLSQTEVAAETGVTVGIVNNQITATLKKLRQILGAKR